MKALEYIKGIQCPEVEEYPDLFGELISEGVMAYSPAQRKSIQNNVGELMERLLAEALGFDYTNIEGADITSDTHQIIAEVKNRHNTLNGGGRQRVIRVMKDLTLSDRYRGYKKYLVIVHPKTVGLEKPIGQAITEISAAKFCKKFGVDFREKYLELLDQTAAHYGLAMPEIPSYYEEIVFSTRKSRRKRLTNRT